MCSAERRPEYLWNGGLEWRALTVRLLHILPALLSVKFASLCGILNRAHTHTESDLHFLVNKSSGWPLERALLFCLRASRGAGSSIFLRLAK